MENSNKQIQCKDCSKIPLIGILYENGKVNIESKCENHHYNIEEFRDFYKRNLNASSSLPISNAEEEQINKTEFEKLSKETIENLEYNLKQIENDYFILIKNAGEIYDELIKYQQKFLEAMLRYKEINRNQINFCKDLLNSYKEMEKENNLNFEIINNIKNILNFKPINFEIDNNFPLLAKVQKYFTYLNNNYNCILNQSNNFLNTEYQITNEEKNFLLSNFPLNIHYENEKDKPDFYDEYDDHESGNIYYGEIIRKDDIILKHGRGIILYKNGGKYFGNFENDHMNGYGIFYGKDGRIEKGNKLNDYKEGFYILKLPNDIIIKDYYINNLKEGFSYKYYPNGDIIIEEKKK